MGTDLRSGGGAPPLRAQLLGTTRIMVGDRTVPDHAWTRQAARSLLLLLLITPGHRLPRERVLDALWPDASPESADRSLRKAVHEARRALQPDLRRGRDSAYIAVGADTVALREGPGVQVDAEMFEAHLARARTGPPAALRRGLKQALALHGGELLAGDPYAEWIDARREHLRRLHRRAVLDLTELDLRAGDPLASMPALEAMFDRDPTDEETLRAIMRGLAAAGRRDDALLWHRRGVDALRSELDTEPSVETQALARDIHATTPAPVPPIPEMISIRPHARIPASPNRLIGRDRDIEQLQDLLLADGVRLVTVTGPGGVGKTRLAQEAVRHLGDHFTDGMCYVPLASVRDPAKVVPAIAMALGLAERGPHAIAETLHATLRDRELLLVLDNFEHVIEAAPQVADLLATAARLSLVVTSREPLRLRAEHELALAPLSLPPANGSGRSRSLVRYGTVQLFLHRAHAVRPSFVLTDENAETVATICQRLDGLPLAIELAAARIRDMTPAELLTRLDDRFATLAGGFRDLPARQQSLYAAIDWSHDLLPPRLRALFRRIAVFAGSFTIEAAAAIAERLDTVQPPRSVLKQVSEGIDELVRRSLVQRAVDGAGERFEMLESIREYGLGMLSGHEADEARRAHATWYLAIAERAEPVLAESDRVDWLEAELDNLRGALAWTLDHHEPVTALRLAGALRRFWLTHGLLTEGREWLERALGEAAWAPPEIRAKALFAAGELSFFLEDYARAESCAREGLALCTSMGDTRGIADAALGLGQIARYTGNPDDARRHLETGIELLRPTGESAQLAHLLTALGAIEAQQGDQQTAEHLMGEALSAFRQAGNARGEAAILANLSSLAQQRGDPDHAVPLAEEAVEILRRLRDAYGTSSVLLQLASLRIDGGDLDRAGEHLRESLAIAREHRLDAQAATGIRALASLAVAMGRFERAARLFGAAGAFCDKRGIAPPASRDDLVPNGEITARMALGDLEFSAMSAALASLPPDQIIAEALADRDAPERRVVARERSRPSAFR